MFQTRSLTTGFLVASLGIAAGFAVLGSSTSASAGDAACAKLKVAEVKAVCEKGGIAAVKKSMKAATDEATKAGKKHECKDCHSNQTDYATKDNAGKDFESDLKAYFK